MPELRLIKGMWPMNRTPSHEQRVERIEQELWATTVEDLHDRLDGHGAAALITLLERCALEEAVDEAQAEHDDRNL